jgi:UDPglucose 6-dehydrogenase
VKKPVIGYAGMTHLGLVSASVAAGQGFRTIAFDPDAALISRLKRGDLPVSEPGLPELIKRRMREISFSADDAALGECDVVYVAVDVPTDDRGQSDLTPVKADRGTRAPQGFDQRR